MFVSPHMHAWTCNGPLPADCHGRAPAKFKSEHDYPATRALSEARTSEPGYDAHINLGPTDASPPAANLLEN